MIFARFSPTGTTAWYLPDHLGSVRDLANTSGQVIDHVKYDSFGRVLYESQSSNGDRFKYTARELDSNGLYYYRARYYDAAIGRFLSEDPKRLAAGDANMFRYVGNAPTLRIDPMGTDGIDPSGMEPPRSRDFYQDATTPEYKAWYCSFWWQFLIPPTSPQVPPSVMEGALGPAEE